MLLGYTDIVAIIQGGVIQKADIANVNSASLDIRLGKTILVETGEEFQRTVWLGKKDSLSMKEWELPYILKPGEFILASSQETFFLPPHISAEYKEKSSMARIGLDHAKAGWCDAGWIGSVLTLELKNISQHHSIGLREGDKIGQMVFFWHSAVPADKSYAVRGRYNFDKIAQGAKK